MTDRPTMLRATLGLAAVLALVTACGTTSSTILGTTAPTTQETATPTESGAGGGGGAVGLVDCSLLAPSDFADAGITGASDPSDNPDGTGHYCVYAGTSGATGGIEFDVFPHDAVSDAQATYQTVIGEGPEGQPAAGASFDESSYAVADKVGFLAVRQGPLVFALAAPDDPATEGQLVTLAKLVVERAGAAAAP